MNTVANPALIPPGAPPGESSPAPIKRGAPAVGGGGQSFADVLQGETSRPRIDRLSADGLQFSRHALARLQRRQIDLDPGTLGRLKEGVGRAASKGSRDSVVLIDGTAFVVSVSNRTVITAVGSEHMREHVFTNIDSAVIA